MKRNRTEIERAIIGTILADPGQLSPIASRIRADYFADGFCQRVFEAAQELHRANVEATPENLGASGTLEAADTRELFAVIAEANAYDIRVLTLALCEEEATSRLRGGLELAGREEDPFEAVTRARAGCQAAESVLLGAIRRTKAQRIDRVLLHFREQAEGKRTPFPTGFPTLDTMLNGGYSEAGLSFCGGYAGEGKTSFALAVAVHLARRGVKVEFLEGEMPEHELHDRAARMLYGAGEQRRHDWLAEYKDLPIDILLLADRTPAKLLASVDYAVVNGARFIIVDYLQAFAQMQSDTDRHYLAIKNLSAQLRSLVLRYAENGTMIHVMALSNLNRNEMQRGRPGLASLYGSSGLAHDCTEALMIHSEEKTRTLELMSGRRDVTVEVVKARNGRRGPLPFLFDGALQRFTEEDAAH